MITVLTSTKVKVLELNESRILKFRCKKCPGFASHTLLREKTEDKQIINDAKKSWTLRHKPNTLPKFYVVRLFKETKQLSKNKHERYLIYEHLDIVRYFKYQQHYYNHEARDLECLASWVSLPTSRTYYVESYTMEMEMICEQQELMLLQNLEALWNEVCCWISSRSNIVLQFWH